MVLLIATVSASGQLNYVNLTVGGSGCAPNDDITNCLTIVLGAYPHQTIAINPGTYQISGHVTIGEDQALIGAGSNGGGTALFLAASGEIIFASTNATKGGLQHLQVTGAGGSSVGIQVGGTTSSGVGHNLQFEDLLIGAFGTAVQFGYNAYEDSFRDVLFENDGSALLVPSSATGGERMVLSNCEFTGSTQGINDAAGFEWMIDNSSFDQFTGVAVTINGVGNAAQPGHLRISHSHFEPPTNGVLPPNGFIYSPSGPATIDIQDTTFLTSTVTGTNQAFITASTQTAQVNVIGRFAYSAQAICLVNYGASIWLQSMAGDPNKVITPSCNSPSIKKLVICSGGPF